MERTSETNHPLFFFICLFFSLSPPPPPPLSVTSFKFPIFPGKTKKLILQHIQPRFPSTIFFCFLFINDRFSLVLSPFVFSVFVSSSSLLLLLSCLIYVGNNLFWLAHDVTNRFAPKPTKHEKNHFFFVFCLLIIIWLLLYIIFPYSFVTDLTFCFYTPTLTSPPPHLIYSTTSKTKTNDRGNNISKKFQHIYRNSTKNQKPKPRNLKFARALGCFFHWIFRLLRRHFFVDFSSSKRVVARSRPRGTVEILWTGTQRAAGSHAAASRLDGPW